MQVFAAISLFGTLVSFAVLVLVLRDIDVRKKMFRRYVKQIDESGRITEEVSWWAMRYSFFVRSGWFYRMPSSKQRPDLRFFPELVRLRDEIERNWKLVPRLAVALALSLLLFWFGVR